VAEHALGGTLKGFPDFWPDEAFSLWLHHPLWSHSFNDTKVVTAGSTAAVASAVRRALASNANTWTNTN